MADSKAKEQAIKSPWIPHAAVPAYLHVTWWFFWYHFVLAVWAPVQSLIFGKPQLLHKFDDDGRHGVYGYTCRSLFYTLVTELHEAEASEQPDAQTLPRKNSRLAGSAGASSPSS